MREARATMIAPSTPPPSASFHAPEISVGNGSFSVDYRNTMDDDDNDYDVMGDADEDLVRDGSSSPDDDPAVDDDDDEDEDDEEEDVSQDEEEDDDEDSRDDDDDDDDDDGEVFPDDDDDDDDRASSSGGRPPPGGRDHVAARPTLPDVPHVREIGRDDGTVWSLSTAKPGNGVEQIRDDSAETYWQSDGTGAGPHLLDVRFGRRRGVCGVALYLDYNLDESYTPRRLSIRSGTTSHDLAEVRAVETREPVGWVMIPLEAPRDPLDDDDDDDNDGEDENARDDEHRQRRAAERPLRTHFLQVAVLSMHQNGRDTHVRQVKLFGPRRRPSPTDRKKAEDDDDGRRGWTVLPGRFRTVEMTQFNTIR